MAILLAGCAEWSTATPAAPPPPPDNSIDVRAEPAHHLEVENQYLRAYKVELEPDKATQKHHHEHDYVTVTFGSAEISNEVTGKAPAKVALADGDVRLNDGGGPSHLVRNVAPTTFRNATIEFVKDTGKGFVSEWEQDTGSFPLQGGTRDILFARGSARVSRIELKPGGVLPKSDIGEHCLFVAVSDLDLREESTANAIKLGWGSVKWQDTGAIRKLTNKGAKAAKILLVEFK